MPRKKKRMDLPKTKKDLEKIVEEVQASHAHEHEHHHHHHHHHAEIDELLTVLELLLDSLNANVDALSSRVSRNSMEIARIYKILGHIVAYLASTSEDQRRKHLESAIRELGVITAVATVPSSNRSKS